MPSATAGAPLSEIPGGRTAFDIFVFTTKEGRRGWALGSEVGGVGCKFFDATVLPDAAIPRSVRK